MSLATNIFTMERKQSIDMVPAAEEEAEAGLMDSQLSLGELDGLEVSTSEARLRIDCVSVQNPGLDPRAFIDMCTRFDWHAST